MTGFRHPCLIRNRIVTHLLASMLSTAVLLAPNLVGRAQSVGTALGSDVNFAPLLLILLLIAILFAIPASYYLWTKKRNPTQSLLMVSTDEEARTLVKKVARRVGYNAVTVYRYEDALDRLRQDITLNMIIVDDSVPQYEAGMLLSMLQRLPMGIRPLILIHDSSEAGQTAPSYRAEVVLERPITERALEDAIRTVRERVEIDW